MKKKTASNVIYVIFFKIAFMAALYKLSITVATGFSLVILTFLSSNNK